MSKVDAREMVFFVLMKMNETVFGLFLKERQDVGKCTESG